MKRKLTHFTESDLKRIEAAVREAEAKTSGEIVPLIVGASHQYWWVHGFYGALGWGLVTAILLGLEQIQIWFIPFWEAALLQFLGIGVFSLLGFSDVLTRWVLPRSWMAEQVHRQCLANFTALGLHETRDRTGILIYLSLLEHRVEVLADRGINERVPEGYWQQQVDGIIRGIREDRAVEGLVGAISEVGGKLSESFPPTEGDRNELADHPRLGHS